MFHPGAGFACLSQLGFSKDQNIWVVGGNSVAQVPMAFEEASNIYGHDFKFCHYSGRARGLSVSKGFTALMSGLGWVNGLKIGSSIIGRVLFNICSITIVFVYWERLRRDAARVPISFRRLGMAWLRRGVVLCTNLG